MDLTWTAVAAAFLVASFVKGTTGMGFPLIATPMVALVTDIKTAFALLVLPNIVMDTLQIVRGRWPWHLWRRLVRLLGMTVVGAALGTRILVSVSERFIYVALAAVILVFLASTYLRIPLTVAPRWESWLNPSVGLAAGTLTGVTNVPGPLAAVYLLALGLGKRDFVQAMASIVLTAKLSQWAALSQWGLYTIQILWSSVALTAVALAAFWVGLRVQDRVPQVVFSRILHALLFGMGVFFSYRGLS